MNNIELTTMCALFHEGKVLMIERCKTWKGWAFPGGHLENKESLYECAIREMYEETGAQILELHYKGFTHFYNTISGQRHIISNYTAFDYSGTIKLACDEGRMKWIDINSITKLQLAEGMKYRLPLFLNEGIQELYVEWDAVNGYTRIEYKDMQ